MVEVMLMADVKKLGKAGAIVKVAPGYARNMLLPRGLAAPVTEAAKRKLAKLEEARAKARAEAKKAAQAVAKLYGSVSATDLLAAIEADRGVKLERSQLDLPDHLREVGEYKATLDLGEGVKAPFTVKIVEEAAQA